MIYNKNGAWSPGLGGLQPDRFTIRTDTLDMSVHIHRKPPIQLFVLEYESQLLTFRAEEIESPTMPLFKESLTMTARSAAKKTVKFPTNSSRTASHL